MNKNLDKIKNMRIEVTKFKKRKKRYISYRSFINSIYFMETKEILTIGMFISKKI